MSDRQRRFEAKVEGRYKDALVVSQATLYGGKRLEGIHLDVVRGHVPGPGRITAPPHDDECPGVYLNPDQALELVKQILGAVQAASEWSNDDE